MNKEIKRINLKVSKELWTQLKIIAAKDEKTLQQLCEDVLSDYVKKKNS